jgi:hypothetical protein
MIRIMLISRLVRSLLQQHFVNWHHTRRQHLIHFLLEITRFKVFWVQGIREPRNKTAKHICLILVSQAKSLQSQDASPYLGTGVQGQIESRHLERPVTNGIHPDSAGAEGAPL